MVATLIGTTCLAVLAIGVSGVGAAPAHSSASPPGYTGVEATLPTAFTSGRREGRHRVHDRLPEPDRRERDAGLPAEGRRSPQGQRLGCKVITLDDKVNPDTQVSNMQQLLAQKVERDHLLPARPEGDRARAEAGEGAGRAR